MNQYDDVTNAHSVYNVLSRARRDMTRAEVLAYLNRAWSADMDESDMAGAVQLLARKGFASERNGKLRPWKRHPNGLAAAIIRTVDRADIMRAEFF